MGLINQSVYPNSMTAPYESRTYSEWMSEDPVIIADKFVYDKTYKTFRIGDGTSKFSELNWFVSSRVPEDIIGIEWDRESTTPTLRRIDRLGNDITLTAADFDHHRRHRCRRCCNRRLSKTSTSENITKIELKSFFFS